VRCASAATSYAIRSSGDRAGATSPNQVWTWCIAKLKGPVTTHKVKGAP